MADRVEEVRPGARRRRGSAATGVLVLAVVAALVIPALLFARGWREAQTIRGVGAGRGVFTAAACGDRKVSVSTDGDGNQTTHVSYTCTGTFHGSSVALDDVAVHSDFDYHAGVRTAAYVAGVDHVRLANNREAAAKMALWFTLVFLIAGIEAAVIRLLHHRTRRRAGVGIGLGDVAMSGVISLLVGGPFLVLLWLASYLALLGIYAA